MRLVHQLFHTQYVIKLVWGNRNDRNKSVYKTVFEELSCLTFTFFIEIWMF